MDKHMAWDSFCVAPKSVGSMTTKGQMKPTFRVSSKASPGQSGENSQSNDPEHTIVSSILTGLIFRRNGGRRAACLNPSSASEAAEFELRVSKFKSDTRTS